MLREVMKRTDLYLVNDLRHVLVESKCEGAEEVFVHLNRSPTLKEWLIIDAEGQVFSINPTMSVLVVYISCRGPSEQCK
jgi:hypothetical protein